MSKADLTTEQRMDDARKVIELSEMLRSGRRKYLRHKHHGKGFQLSLSGLHEDPATVHTLKEESECDIKGAPEHEGPDALDSHLETIHSGEKFSRELRKSTIMRQQFSEDHRLHKHRRKVVKSHAYFTELFETAGPFPDILDELEMLLPQRSEEPQTHGLTPEEEGGAIDSNDDGASSSVFLTASAGLEEDCADSSQGVEDMTQLSLSAHTRASKGSRASKFSVCSHGSFWS